MKSLIKILLLCVACVGGFFVYQKYVTKVDPSSNSYTVKKGELIQRVTIGGLIEPIRKSTIIAPYKGYVGKIFVKIGDRVKSGDALVTVTESLQSKFQPFPLRSPIDGIVTQIEKREGEATRDLDPKEFILRVEDHSKFFVVAAVPEVDRAKIRIGDKTDIKAIALGDKKYQGVLRELALAAKDKQEQWSGRSQVEFAVRAEVLNPDPDLISGMSVLMDIITASRLDVILVGHEFLVKENDKNFVTTSEGHKKEVKLGLQNEEMFEVLSGLAVGEKLRPVDFSTIVRKL